MLVASKVIFVMGPSCSGKSTIAKELLGGLTDNWVLAEYDAIEDRVGRKTPSEDVFTLLIDTINNHLDAQKSVVVDTNMFYPQKCATLRAQQVEHVFIYAPLEILLQRDAYRTKILLRGKWQADAAHSFLIKSFNHFYPRGIPPEGDLVIDTTQKNLQQAVEAVKIVIKK